MSRLARLLPATLFGRALLTLILTFGAFALAATSAIVVYTLLPLAQRSASDLSGIMVMAARTLEQLPPELRDGYRDRLASEYRIWLAEERPESDAARYFFPYLSRLEAALSERLGTRVEMVTTTREGEPWFWTAIAIDGRTLWVGFPRSRIGTQPLRGVMVISVVALGLILITTLVLAGRVSLPLKRLAKAAEEVALGFSPNDLPETGPVELANLARQFNETSRQVRELLANRTMLLTGISHDLRTPLTRLRLAVAMLPEATPPDLVARLERDIDEMNALITQAVELGGTLGAGRREDVDLRVLLDHLIATRPRVLWRRGPACRCRVDALALRRIVGNLLENALRYSQDLVEVRLECQGGHAAILVLDRGPGIPEPEREAVFRPYYRLEVSRSRQTGGAGLGLAVARQLALANKMELRLGARRGGGTVASVRLPEAATVAESGPGRQS